MIFFLYFLKNHLPRTRFAVSISSKIAGSVQRNYMKRKMREWFRSRQHMLHDAHDIWISIRKNFERRVSVQVEHLFDDAIKEVRQK